MIKASMGCTDLEVSSPSSAGPERKGAVLLTMLPPTPRPMQKLMKQSAP